MIRFFLILTWIVLLFSCRPHSLKDPLYSSVKQKQAQKDFLLFRDILEKAHPALTEYINETRKNFLFDSLYKTIDSDLPLRDFFNKLSFLINEISCSHTIVSLPSGVIDSLYNRKLFFPFPVSLFPTGLFANSEYIVPHGTKVLAINNIPVARLFDSLTLYNPVDGVHRETQKYLSSTDFSYDFFVRFGGFEKFTLLIKDTAGVIKTIAASAATLDEFHEQKNDRYYYDATDVSYSLAIDEDYRYALIRLTTFEYISPNQQRAFENFLKNSFELIRKKGEIHTLIIDLRENVGGDLYNCFLLNSYLSRQPFSEYKSVSSKIKEVPYTEFLSPFFGTDKVKNINNSLKEDFVPDGSGRYLLEDSLIGRWEPEETRFLNDIFIITNQKVMSSASYFALLASRTAGARIIGVETQGGGFSCNGFSTLKYVLPNTKIGLQFPYARLLYSYGDPKPDRGILPDYFVPDTYESFKNNEDKQLLFIRDSLILKNR